MSFSFPKLLFSQDAEPDTSIGGVHLPACMVATRHRHPQSVLSFSRRIGYMWGILSGMWSHVINTFSDLFTSKMTPVHSNPIWYACVPIRGYHIKRFSESVLGLRSTALQLLCCSPVNHQGASGTDSSTWPWSNYPWGFTPSPRSHSLHGNSPSNRCIQFFDAS